MKAECIAPAKRWLSQNSKLSDEQMDALALLTPGLLQALPQRKPAVISLAGAPGTGKSTLAHMLACSLNVQRQECVVLSLDNYYLPLGQRKALANRVHPLLIQRGVPGTHDLQRLQRDLARLQSAEDTLIQLPVFDKASDDRVPEERVLQLDAPPSYIVLEGWMAGLPPQESSSLEDAVNALESDKDRSGVWRRYVNNALAQYQQQLWSQLDARWLLMAPDWEQVVEWRWQQEQAIHAGQRYLIDRAAVEVFLSSFERLVGHLHASRERWSSLNIYLDHKHHPQWEPPH